MKNLLKALTLIIFLLTLAIGVTCPPKAHAQINSIGIASYLDISGDKIEDGSIVVVSDKGYSISKTPYESNIVGVVNLSPAVSLKTDKQKKGFPVVTSGTVYVKVNGTNGTIKKGNSITTSAVRGTGMKASDSGFVLGEALNDAVFAKANETKIISVAVSPHFFQQGNQFSNSILDVFKLSKIAAYEKPSKTLQYILSAIIVVLSFGSGFLILSRIIAKGIEALGRNPLAGRMIQLSIIFNVLLIVVIVAAGSALAYLVIRL